MPALNHCPSCNRPLRVPDELIGRNVKCPDCGTVFQSTAEGGQAAPLPVSPAGTDQLPPPTDGTLWDRSRAAGSLTGPAIGLLVLSVLWMLVLGWTLLGVTQVRNDPQALDRFREDFKKAQERPLTPEESKAFDRIFDRLTSAESVGVLTAILAANAVIFIGAIQMLRMRTRPLAILAAILATLPVVSSPCCFIGIPFGIWALVMLFRPGIAEAFGHRSLPDIRHDFEGP